MYTYDQMRLTGVCKDDHMRLQIRTANDFLRKLVEWWFHFFKWNEKCGQVDDATNIDESRG